MAMGEKMLKLVNVDKAAGLNLIDKQSLASSRSDLLLSSVD